MVKVVRATTAATKARCPYYLRSQKKAGVAKAPKPKPALAAKKAAKKMACAQKKKASTTVPKEVPPCKRANDPEPEQTPRSSSRIPLSTARRTESVISLADVNNFQPKQRTPQSKLDDLKGMEDIKDSALEDVIGPFVDPQMAAWLRLEVPKGVLLTGVPGTGKTSLADAIVSELRRMSKDRQISYYQESGACMSKYFGESEQNLRNLFQTAQANAPAVILLDELDALGRTRSEGPGSASCMYTILTTLLEEINNITPGKVLVIAATNCPQFCDGALKRKGRFDIKLEIPLPGPDAREDILSHYLDKKGLELDEEDMEELVRGTKGLPGSDLKGLVDSIHRRCIRRVFPKLSYLTMSKTQVLKKVREIQELDFERDVQPEMELAGGVEE